MAVASCALAESAAKPRYYWVDIGGRTVLLEVADLPHLVGLLPVPSLQLAAAR